MKTGTWIALGVAALAVVGGAVYFSTRGGTVLTATPPPVTTQPAAQGSGSVVSQIGQWLGVGVAGLTAGSAAGLW